MQKSHNDIGIKSKVWLESNGEPVFGRGRRLLLIAIEKYGSISRAAKEINISYRKAWSYIKAMEERLGIKLVEKQIGGIGGGGAVITQSAKEFLKKFELIEKKINEVADYEFKKVF